MATEKKTTVAERVDALREVASNLMNIKGDVAMRLDVTNEDAMPILAALEEALRVVRERAAALGVSEENPMGVE